VFRRFCPSVRFQLVLVVLLHCRLVFVFLPYLITSIQSRFFSRLCRKKSDFSFASLIPHLTHGYPSSLSVLSVRKSVQYWHGFCCSHWRICRNSFAVTFPLWSSILAFSQVSKILLLITSFFILHHSPLSKSDGYGCLVLCTCEKFWVSVFGGF
jgi:hypothetical protein